MTTQFNRLDRFSIQASFGLGDRNRHLVEDRVRTLYLDALESFAEGNLEATIAITTQVLELDPSFQPAAETLGMARDLLQLQTQMEAIREGEIPITAE